ncbi:MAG: hypothetical protein U1F98_13005 [Verrucomicrobiota bacterium]
MKYLVCVAAAGLLLAGCGDNSAPSSGAGSGGTNASASDSSGGGSVVTAPVDYLGALGAAQKKAIKTVDTSAISSAVRQFQVEMGRYPSSLDELVQQKYLARIPKPPYGTRLVYDPSTGEVSVVKQ